MEGKIEIPFSDSVVKFTRVPDDISVGVQNFDISNMTYDQYERLMIGNRMFSTLLNRPRTGSILTRRLHERSSDTQGFG